ncbi:helix-turn-helix domain-containing protein [Prauserella oleivorans]|uniref:Helix-turn-helix domain-containing protein n=1 Tax=Prauserella oleivorans TaxID=1478153 RepID=A0ABW5W7H6_9PSEU
MASTVTSRRKQLGNELRHARISAGLTQQQVAQILGCTQGKVNKIESGAVGVKLGDVRAMLDAYGVAREEADTLLNLARAAASQRGHWSGYRSLVPHWFRTFTDLEPAAAEIMTWHGERIPGPLQSEHYMLKQFTEFGATDITSLVRNRLDRKAVFDQDQPPYYRFILSESALRRAPGGRSPAVMLDQLEHLLELDRSKARVYIHVLPFAAKLAAVPNDFTIMRFPDSTRDFVYIEHAAGGIYLDDVKDFQIFVDSWDRLRGAALERPETREFIKNLAEQYRAELNDQTRQR